ncbi:hypothetical protein ScPMuIL_003456 [Solemya velum]
MAEAEKGQDVDELEKEHFIRILNSFKYYRTHCMKRIQNAEKHFEGLSEHHKELLPDFLENLNNLRQCVEDNSEIIQMITSDADQMFENKSHGLVENGLDDIKRLPPTSFDMDKVMTTLKQFVRDWSEDGVIERTACYDPVIKEIQRRFPPQRCEASSVYILVPGAGLGRLAFELAKQGYSCQGNEWSLFMLLASNFVLNKCREVNAYTLYPWISQWSNNKMTGDQLAPVKFPDVSPSDIPPNVNFSMAAGDFLEVYKELDIWDCIATVFFIDTAHNIVAYIEAMWRILKPGGYWVNLGPLLYHYAGLTTELSIELSYEQVKSVIKKVGFVIEKEEMNLSTTYTQNPRSMMQYRYESVFFVARKPS